MHKKLQEATQLIGTRFGKWVMCSIVEERAPDRKIRVKCICDCGQEGVIILSVLKRGDSKSCGCLLTETSKANLIKARKAQSYREPKLGSAKRVYENYSDGDITFDLFLEISQRDCFYCGAPPANIRNAYIGRKQILPERLQDGYFTYNGLDRVDNTKGHMKDNVVPCCYDCNKSKLQRTKDAFIEHAYRICERHPRPKG